MSVKKTLFYLMLFLVSSFCHGQKNVVERGDWVQHFDQFGASGTIVVVDERGTYPKNWVFDHSRHNYVYPLHPRLKFLIGYLL